MLSKKPTEFWFFTYEWNNSEARDFIKDDTIKWVDDKSGFIRLYQEPLELYPYVIGGDTKGEGKDYFAGTVLNNVTGERVATLHLDTADSKPYTYQMYCLGRYYNNALIGIEINFNTAPIEELARLKYPLQYYRKKYDTILNKVEKKR